MHKTDHDDVYVWTSRYNILKTMRTKSYDATMHVSLKQ